MKKLASICLITYNQEKFIEEALTSVLNQDYKNLEIVISDDCSSDRTFELIKSMVNKYKGEHRVILNRNKRNIGLVGNVNKVLYELTTGEVVFLAAGDDISNLSRVSEVMNFFQENPGVHLIGSNIDLIDENSSSITQSNIYKVLEDTIYSLKYYFLKEYRHPYGPTRAITRDLINAFPPFHSECPTEDTPLVLRGFLYGQVGKLANHQVKYRKHSSNISNPEGLKKMNIKGIFEQYRNDINYAFKKNYISWFDSFKLFNLINRRYYNRVVRNKNKFNYLVHMIRNFKLR